MIGKFVMTENELLKTPADAESVGMGSYTIDSHNVQRYITPEGDVQNEGDIGVPTAGPYADCLRLAGAQEAGRPRTCSCPCASPARTSPLARSGWSRCS